ncbi:MAG TPA: S8 family serine peptidase, partial [Candidatus Binatia bacterium]|nr:S8 family serine peptidase [Candidatus Binatia bacterium]
EEVRDSFIFVFTDNVPAFEVAGRANAIARASGGRITHLYTTALKGFAAKMPGDAAARMAARNPNIAYYEPDSIAFAFPKPPWAGGGSGEESTTCSIQETPWGITRVDGPANGTGLTAWVIDTGIDLDHPDLNVDVGRSANFVLRGKDSPDDGHGHGTHVAGTIAALDNGCDVVGVAAGASVVAVRVLDNSGSGSYAGVIAGVDYVAANAGIGDAANMSLGGPYSQALNAAVVGAASNGIRFALAAGNSADDASNYSPASADDPNIFTVSAMDSNDGFAWFSNYGNPPVDCAAPGVNVLSTKKGGGTTTMSGTSMAAPHVAGLLLFGGLRYDGSVVGDPDNTPDAICHF